MFYRRKGGFVQGEGHEIDGKSLNYKTGDAFKMQVLGLSDKPLIIFDSLGKAFTQNISDLPSVRGQGEPVSSKVQLSPGSTVEGVLIGELTQHYLLVADTRFRFYCYNERFNRKKIETANWSLKFHKGVSYSPQSVSQTILIAWYFLLVRMDVL